jgi:hypothetical protein
MAQNETSVSGDVVFQDGDDLSETNLTRTAAKSNLTDYVERGLGLNADGAAGTVDIGSGHAIVQDGINAYDLFPNQQTGIALPGSGTNYIYVAIQPGSDDDVYYHIDEDESPPADPSILIGTADASAGTSTVLNRRPNQEIGDADIDRLVAALDANGQDINNVGSVSTEQLSSDDDSQAGRAIFEDIGDLVGDNNRPDVDVKAYRNDGTWLFVMNAEWDGSNWVKQIGGEAARLFEIGGDGVSHFTVEKAASAGTPLELVERNRPFNGGFERKFNQLSSPTGLLGGKTRTEATENVGTTATTILQTDTNVFNSGLLLIFGFDGAGNRFRDVVTFTGGIGVGINVLDEATEGTPATRSYSRDNRALELAMGSDTYDVNVSALISSVDVTA